MMTQMRRSVLVVSAMAAVMIGCLLTGMLVQPAQAIDTKDILKVGGVLLAVNQFGGEMDHFVNDLMKQKNAEAMGATKVVPIVSVGQGAFIGAAQVVGVPANVQRVQAVATVETAIGKVTGTLLVPISTKMPGSKLSRVDGVGVTAIADIKL